MTAVKRLLGFVAVLTWIAAPLALAGIVTARSERAVRTAPPTSAWVPAGPVQDTTSRAIAAQVERRTRPPLLAPAWSGLVEEVRLRVGEPLRSGEAVAIIDGIERRAAATGRPLRRSLVPEDRGRDVADLNEWLASVGYEASDGDRFGGATQRGVLALRRDLGVPAPPATDLEARPDEFDPAWLVFLTEAEVTVSATGLQAGAPAPAAGTVIADLAPQVASVSLVLADPSGATSADPSSGAPTPSDSPTVHTPGDATTGPPDQASPPIPSGTPLSAVAEGARLRRSGTDLGAISTDGSLPAATELAVVQVLGDDASASLELVEPAPAGARRLIANAVFTGPTGATCVAARASSSRETTVHLVLPIGVTTAQPLLVGVPAGEVEVQVNPPPSVRRQCRT